MCLIQPHIDLQNRKLLVSAPSMETLEIDLDYFPDKMDDNKSMRVCGIK